MSDRVQIRARWRAVLAGALLAAAGAVYVVVVLAQRPVAWKLADQAFCLADAAGFREAACPGLYPGGALRWTSSLLMTTGLVDGIWWLPYVLLPALVAALSWFAAFPRRVGPAAAPFLLTAAALLHVGTQVWLLPDYAFPMTNLLGMLAAYALVATLRPLARKGVPAACAAAALCCPAFVPLGLYALAAGAFLLLAPWFRTPGEPLRRPGLRSLAGTLAGVLPLAATPALAAALVYDDLAVGAAVGYAQSVLAGALLTPFGLWPVLAFLQPVRTVLPAVSRDLGVRLACVYGLAALMGLGLPRDDLRGQLTMARRLGEGRFEEALAVMEANRRPLRMEFAYRVLALWRTGRLETDLFARPFTSFHRTTAAQELAMDGETLLFQYGHLLAARTAAMEKVTARGWQPGFLRTLGDVAFLTGETALAKRNWTQLARCPFRGEFAARRLRALAAGRGLDHPGFEDLRPVAAAADLACGLVEARPQPPFFDLKRDNVETFVYTRLLQVRSLPPPDLARLVLAAYLLEKDAKALAGSRGVMDRLCPQGPWPRCWQQGMLAHLSSLPEEARAREVAGFRDGSFSADEVDRFDRFVADLQGGKLSAEEMRDRYGDTYYFYDVFVR